MVASRFFDVIRVSQVVEFCGKEGKYQKSEDTDVFYLKKEKKIEKKISKFFDQSESWKLKNSGRVSNWCSLEPA